MLWPVRGEGLDVVPRTGQRLCYDATGKVISCADSGQDGEWRIGAQWPEPRFEILNTGVLDHLTGLLWRRSANLTLQPVVWHEALAAVARLNQAGAAGRTWRPPTLNELEALVDCAAHSPALPSGHRFTDEQDIDWSSTSLFEPDWAWALFLEKAATGVGQKRFAEFSVWAVATVGRLNDVHAKDEKRRVTTRLGHHPERIQGVADLLQYTCHSDTEILFHCLQVMRDSYRVRRSPRLL